MQSASNNQIYVGDIPNTADEAFLSSMFKECGTIIPGGIELKQHPSGKNKFAFITFENHESAQRALSEMNYTKLDGIPIRISWSDAETKRIRNSGLGNLFIHGLDESIEVSQLHEAFSNFGDIISCKIPLNDDGKSRGYGYIQFRNPEDAERARTDLQEASINGKAISIMEYKKPIKTDPETTFTNIYFKAEGVNAVLPDQLKDDESAKKFLSKFGKITSIHVENGKFGFANFETHEDAVEAVKGTDKAKLEDVELICNRMMNHAERAQEKKRISDQHRQLIEKETKGRNLYVKNFSEDITKEEFEEYFKKFGEVESVEIKEDPDTHKSKGYGFVLFKTEEGAENCLKQCINEKFANGSNSPYVGRFQTKDARERTKKAEARARTNQMAGNTSMIPQDQLILMITNYLKSLNIDTTGITFESLPVQVFHKSAKDILKERLQEKGIVNLQLKKKLTSISDKQADNIVKSEEKIQKWIEL